MNTHNSSKPIFSLLLVEDEPLILNHLKNIVENNPFFIANCITAGNGIDAYEILKMHTIDIVITDINMPLLNGLDFIAKAQNNHYNPLFIVLSGYDYFDYVKSALQKGVFDYILKPLDQDQIIDVLQKAIQVVQKNQKQNTADFLASAMGLQGDSYPNDNKLLKKHTILHAKVYAKNYYFLFAFNGFLSVNSYDEASNLVSIQDFTQLRTFCDTHAVDFYVFLGKYSHEIIIVLALDNIDNCTKKNDLNLKAIAQLLYADLGKTWAIFYHTQMQKVDKIEKFLFESHRFIENAYTAFSTGLFLIFEHNTLDYSPHNSNSSFIMLQQKWFDAWQKHSIKEINRFFTQQETEWERINPSWQMLLAELHYFLSFFEEAFCEYADFIPHAEDICLTAKNYTDISSAFCTLYLQCTKEQTSHKNFVAQDLIYDIKAILDKNFLKSFSYAEFYALTGYNARYISGVFKTFFGSTPTQYVKKLRIEFAKKLMTTQPHMLLKDVAVASGYSDQFYFSRVFKEICGISPSTFLETL